MICFIASFCSISLFFNPNLRNFRTPSNMAILLIKYIRRKLKENEAKKAVPTTDDSHLVPEVASNQTQQQQHRKDNVEHAYAGVPTTAGSHVDSISSQAAVRQKEEDRQRRNRQWKLMIGLALPNFLAAIDVTIVAPAIPQISSHFGRLILTQQHLPFIVANLIVKATSAEASTGS